MLPTLKFYPELLKKTLKARGFETVKDYQYWHGLEMDGDAGNITTRSMLAPRICGYPDCIPDNAEGFAKYGYFPSGYTIKWRFANGTNRLPRLSSSGFTTNWVEAISEAFRRWTDYLDISFQYEPSGGVNWLIDTGRIDGPSGTLAWAEIPNRRNFTGKLNQKIDTSERFIASDEPNSSLIDIVRVMCHEGGHSLGLGHLPTRTHRGALLNPTYGSVIKPQENTDVKELLKVYSAADSGSSNPPDDSDGDKPSPGDSDDGRILVYKGTNHGIATPFKHIKDPELFKIKWVS